MTSCFPIWSPLEFCKFGLKHCKSAFFKIKIGKQLVTFLKMNFINMKLNFTNMESSISIRHLHIDNKLIVDYFSFYLNFISLFCKKIYLMKKRWQVVSQFVFGLEHCKVGLEHCKAGLERCKAGLEQKSWTCVKKLDSNKKVGIFKIIIGKLLVIFLILIRKLDIMI